MKKITIKKMDGTLEEVDLVKSFGIVDIDKDFVILSRNETTPDGLFKVYVSEIKETSPGVFTLVGISDDALWDKVKKAMKEIVQG
jgi:hypothetical protein